MTCFNSEKNRAPSVKSTDSSINSNHSDSTVLCHFHSTSLTE